MPTYPITGLNTIALVVTDLTATALKDGGAAGAYIRGVSILTASNLTINSGDPFRLNVVGTGLELEGIGGTWTLPASTQLIWAGTDATSDGTSYGANEAMLVVRLPLQYSFGSPVVWSDHGAPIWDYIDGSTGFSHRRTYHGEDRYYDFADGTLKASIGMSGLNCETGRCFLGGYAWPSPQDNSYHGFSALLQNDAHVGDAFYAGDPDGTITGSVNANGHIHSHNNIEVNPTPGQRENGSGLFITSGGSTFSKLRIYTSTAGAFINVGDFDYTNTGADKLTIQVPVDITGNTAVTGTLSSTSTLSENSKRVVVPDRVTAGAGINIASDNGAGTVVVTNTGVITEADTLATVTGRGATTSTATTLSSTSNDLHGKVTIDATGHSGTAVIDGVDVVTVSTSAIAAGDVVPVTWREDVATNGQAVWTENIVPGVSFDIRCAVITSAECNVNWRILH